MMPNAGRDVKPLTGSAWQSRCGNLTQGYSVLDFPLAARGFEPLPPHWGGRLGWGGRGRVDCCNALHPHPDPPPVHRGRECTDRRGRRKLNDPEGSS